MVSLSIKNIKEIEEEYRDKVTSVIEEKHNFFNELLKKYDKNPTLEVIFDGSSSVYKASASLNLKSKKVLIAEEGNDVIKLVTALMNNLKKAVKHQYELERKDYEYKRKR